MNDDTLTEEERAAMAVEDDDREALARVAAGAVDAGDDDPPPPPQVPVLDARLPDDFGQRVQQLLAADADLARRLENGELGLDEYRAAAEQLARDRATLARLHERATVAADLQRWQVEQNLHASFARFAAGVRDQVDYAHDASARRELAGFVDCIAGRPDAEGKSDGQIWREAHQAYMRLHGERHAAVEQASSRTAAPDFAHIDRLEGFDLEDALARMTEAERERWART